MKEEATCALQDLLILGDIPSRLLQLTILLSASLDSLPISSTIHISKKHLLCAKPCAESRMTAPSDSTP